MRIHNPIFFTFLLNIFTTSLVSIANWFDPKQQPTKCSAQWEESHQVHAIHDVDLTPSAIA